MELATPVVTRNIVLVGNPNSGKSTLFNVLTGLNARVGNYSGVTVERKEGTLIGSAANAAVTVVDLPGAYSLCPQSIDEKISRDALLNHLADSIPPTLVVVVIDALNLERGLYYASQLIELGYPLILALNKIDMISSKGMEINLPRLRELLGVPILPVSAHSKMGIQPLLAQITELLESDSPPRFKWFCRLPRLYWLQIVKIARMLQSGRPRQKHRAEAEAMTLLSDENLLKNTDLSLNYSPEVIASVHEARRTLQSDNKEWNRLVIQSRNDFTAKIYAETVSVHHDRVGEITDQWDHYLTHHIWGYAVFLLIIAIVFNGIFFLAQLPMQWLKEIVEHTGNFISRIIPPGPLESLLENGVVAGVGSVVVFLPQICLLFFFICLLEESGYMARAAFLMDKVMGRVGLAGKSFIPMLSSFACAIPGIMSARTMDRSVHGLFRPIADLHLDHCHHHS